jgi:hypothetical protein
MLGVAIGLLADLELPSVWIVILRNKTSGIRSYPILRLQNLRLQDTCAVVRILLAEVSACRSDITESLSVLHYKVAKTLKKDQH